MTVKKYRVTLVVLMLVLATSSAVAGAAWMQAYMYDHQQFQDVLTTNRLTGDVNSDGIVNQHDVNVLKAHWGMTNATWLDGDVNGDGTVNSLDLSIVSSNWGNSWGTSYLETSV